MIQTLNAVALPFCVLSGTRSTYYLAKAVVPAPLGLIGARRMISRCLAEDIRVRERNTQQRVEYARLVLPLTVQRVEHILLNLRSEVRLLAVGQFHRTDLLREPVESANAFGRRGHDAALRAAHTNTAAQRAGLIRFGAGHVATYTTGRAECRRTLRAADALLTERKPSRCQL